MVSRYTAEPLSTPRLTASRRSGFSLVQISVLLAVSGALLAAYLPGRDASDYNAKVIANIEKINKIEAAMDAFMGTSGTRPCPADGQYDVNHQLFGVAAGVVTPNGSPGSCIGGSPAAPMGPDSGTGTVFVGNIPVKSLGLPDDYAFDAWGRRFTYVVDGRVTDNEMCYNFTIDKDEGNVTIQWKDPSGAVFDTEQSVYAYISHGPDGHGAWPPQGSAVAGRVNRNVTQADALTNAGVDASFTYTPAILSATKVRRERTTGFDDLVYYQKKNRNTCCIGAACQIFNPKYFDNCGQTSSDTLGKDTITFDINADGIDDTIIGAPTADPGARLDAGAVYVVFGSRTPVTAAVDITSLNGTNGFIVEGESDYDNLGYSLASGDVNGDSILDLIIGAPGAPSGSGRGWTYIVLGQGGAWPNSFNASDLTGPTGINGTNGTHISYNTNTDRAATSVSAGDTNGDGIDDVIVGIPLANSSDGQTCVVFGNTNINNMNLDLMTPDGINSKCLVVPPGSGGEIGTSVSACDVNGDGRKDIVSGAPKRMVMASANVGAVYYRFGDTATGTATITYQVDGTNGFIDEGTAPDAETGANIACADFDGDSIQDVAIAAAEADNNGTDSGSIFVHLGTEDVRTATTTLNDLRYYKTDHEAGYRLDGEAGDHAGRALAALRDINGDGIDEIGIGAPTRTPEVAKVEAGGAYIYYGNNTGMLSVNDLAAVEVDEGLIMNGGTAGDHAGTSISSGNTNNTRASAVIISAPDTTGCAATPGGGKVHNFQKFPTATAVMAIP